MKIVADNYQDGHAGYAQNTFFVLDDSPIKTVADLRGKRVGINAYGSAVDLTLRVRSRRTISIRARMSRSWRSGSQTWPRRSARSASTAAW